MEEIAAQKSMPKDQKAKADEAFTKRGMASMVASESGGCGIEGLGALSDCS